MRKLLIAILLARPALAATALPASDRAYVCHYENVLGTSLDLKIFAPNGEAAWKVETAVLDEIDRESKILSAWDRNSEFNKWFATSGKPVAVPAELIQVLGLFDRWRELTGGALDASAESVVRVWNAATAQHRLPTQAEIEGAVSSVHQAHWSLSFSPGKATHLTNTPLALNSFTKSFIMDRAVKAGFAAAPASAIALNVGGDIIVRGSHTERIEIADPRSDAENGPRLATLAIAERTVATSGTYRRGFDIEGRHYSHIVDPRTGQPADEILSSTVVARDPSEAGALATAFSVMAPEESRKLADLLGDIEYLLLKKDGTRVESRGWNRLIASAKPEPAPYSPEPAADGSNMELVVTLELAQIDAPRVHRPYVAVWIENDAKFPVRSLALWYQKPRWLPELKAWYHDDQTRSAIDGSDIATSIASATRPPGKYTLKWDGKDNKGQALRPGKYTVCIEAAREHGTYQIIRQEMDFNGAPHQVKLSGNTEIAAASLDYR